MNHVIVAKLQANQDRPYLGSSNIDTIMQQGTLVIGWVGPALFSILFAAFA